MDSSLTAEAILTMLCLCGAVVGASRYILEFGFGWRNANDFNLLAFICSSGSGSDSFCCYQHHSPVNCQELFKTLFSAFDSGTLNLYTLPTFLPTPLQFQASGGRVKVEIAIKIRLLRIA